MMSNGKLILVPTPIHEKGQLDPLTLNQLKDSCFKDDTAIYVEEHKVARQKWLHWGLPRGAIDRFGIFNEHTSDEAEIKILNLLKEGKEVFLFSDSGLPAFCDPGQNLVRKCHENGIRVTSTPFSNSISLAIALSGINHKRFLFAGFLSTDPDERKKEIDQLANRNETLVLMDTPYRMIALMNDLGSSRLKNRKFFLAANLNMENERCIYGDFNHVREQTENLHKPEFILVISGA